ncbi:MAG: hypothetical protein KDK48_03775 [Chlamydiia bacterium]|nr:hypothetical protein [Chlamydiia bacterium]
MNRRTFFLLFFACIAAAALLYNGFFLAGDKQKIYRIAVISPSTHPSLKSIEEGFKDSLVASPHAFSFRFYRGDGDLRSLNSKITKMALNKYDLIVTVGADATVLTMDKFKEKGIKTPVVFTSVPVSVKEKLIPKRENRQLTGVVEVNDYRRQIQVIKQLKKDLKNITLVYDESNRCIAEDVDEIRTILADTPVSITAVGISEGSQIEPKLTQVENLDVVLVLKDNLVVDNLDQLVLVCNRKKVPLITTELDSVGRGAAVGYGVIERSFGEEAAKRAYNILVDKKKPSDVTVGPVDHFYVLVNDSASVMQGLAVEPETIESLRRQGF